MALNIEAMIADAFMEICEIRPVEKITVKDILERSSLSRKAFYNHFRDKNDLIQYCYQTRIVPQWEADVFEEEFELWNIEWFENMKRYRRFMKGACSSDELNSLKNYILTKGREDDPKMYRNVSDEPISKETEACIHYHAGACRYIIIEWILTDMPISPEDLEKLIKMNREVIRQLLIKQDWKRETKFNNCV